MHNLKERFILDLDFRMFSPHLADSEAEPSWWEGVAEGHGGLKTLN